MITNGAAHFVQHHNHFNQGANVFFVISRPKHASNYTHNLYLAKHTGSDGKPGDYFYTDDVRAARTWPSRQAVLYVLHHGACTTFPVNDDGYCEPEIVEQLDFVKRHNDPDADQQVKNDDPAQTTYVITATDKELGELVYLFNVNWNEWTTNPALALRWEGERAPAWVISAAESKLPSNLTEMKCEAMTKALHYNRSDDSDGRFMITGIHNVNGCHHFLTHSVGSDIPYWTTYQRYASTWSSRAKAETALTKIAPQPDWLKNVRVEDVHAWESRVRAEEAMNSKDTPDWLTNAWVEDLKKEPACPRDSDGIVITALRRITGVRYYLQDQGQANVRYYLQDQGQAKWTIMRYEAKVFLSTEDAVNVANSLKDHPQMYNITVLIKGKPIPAEEPLVPSSATDCIQLTPERADNQDVVFNNLSPGERIAHYCTDAAKQALLYAKLCAFYPDETDWDSVAKKQWDAITRKVDNHEALLTDEERRLLARVPIMALLDSIRNGEMRHVLPVMKFSDYTDVQRLEVQSHKCQVLCVVQATSKPGGAREGRTVERVLEPWEMVMIYRGSYKPDTRPHYAGTYCATLVSGERATIMLRNINPHLVKLLDD